MKKLLSIFILLIILSGCKAWVVKTTPEKQIVNNDNYSIQLIPVDPRPRFFTAFNLTIDNKTDSDIELIWDKTNFIYNGQTNGGFMFEGIVFKDRNNPKQPDVIFARNRFQKTIWPNNLVRFDTTIGWYQAGMDMGDNGIYLTLKVNGKEVKEKLIINMSKENLK